MPQTVAVEQFRGLWANGSPRACPSGYSPDCANVLFTDGRLQPRPGRLLATTLAGATAGFRNLWEFRSGSTPRLLLAYGTQILADWGGATPDLTTAPLVLDTTIHATNRPRGAQFGAKWYFVDGSAAVKCSALTGAGVGPSPVTTLTDLPVPTTPPTLTPGAATGATWLPEGYYAAYTRYSNTDGWGPWSTEVSAWVPAETYKDLTVAAACDSGQVANTTNLELLLLKPGESLPSVYEDDQLEANPGAPPAQQFVTGAGADHQHTQIVISNATVPLSTALEWVPAPVSGCTHLIEWRGRMVYAGPYPGTSGAADTLHISNAGDAEKVATRTYTNPPANYGTYFRVGTDRTPITGLARVGSLLLVLKEHGAWVLEGDSWDTFRLLPFGGDGAGCVSQESIADVGGGVLMGAGRDSLWICTGNGFDTEIGLPVKRIYQAYTDAQRAASFAVFDADRRRYLIFFPATGAALTSTALVYSLQEKAWSYWTGLPGGVALYSSLMSTPGVYLGDPYGAGSYGKLYRLGGTTDESAAISGYWLDRERPDPFPGHWKDVQWGRIWLGSVGAYVTLTAALRQNGRADDLYSVSLTLPTYTAPSVTGKVRASNVVTMDFDGDHLLQIGQSFTLAGVVGWNGTFEVKSTPTARQITYDETGADASGGAGGTVSADPTGSPSCDYRPDSNSAGSYQFALALSTSSNVEITGFELQVADRGAIR